MSRENRRKVLGAALALLGLLAGSGTATAWELPLANWHVQSADFGRFWRQAWSGVQAFLGTAPAQAPSGAGQCVSGDCAEHSGMIDPNGLYSGGNDSNAEHSIMIDPNGGHSGGIDPNGAEHSSGIDPNG